MKHLELFEAKSQFDRFERLIKEILVDLTDQRFHYTLSRETESSYELTILYRGKKKKIIPRYDWDSDETIDYTFEWKDVKETLKTMVEYLSDIYPKIRFTEFKAEGKHVDKEVAAYPSFRQARKSTGFKSLTRYTLEDFSNNLHDNDRLSGIRITFLLRFRGKIKLY